MLRTFGGSRNSAAESGLRLPRWWCRRRSHAGGKLPALSDDILFRPRQAVAIDKCDLSVEIAGSRISFPAMLAPVGYSRIMHPGARWRRRALRAVAPAPDTFSPQFPGTNWRTSNLLPPGPSGISSILSGGREAAEGAIERARNAGFSALVITVDTRSPACANAILATE